MPKLTEHGEKQRIDDIIYACRNLYEEKSFNEITIKDIGERTKFTRTSIYNYFQTKEEIFLEILKEEYIKFSNTLDSIIEENKSLTKEEIAKKIGETLENQKIMLKILSMNIYDIERNSRMEKLVEFKFSYKMTMDSFRNLLIKFCKEKTDVEIGNIIYSFFPFLYGLYPYACATSKQREAMEKANMDFDYMTVYELTYNALNKLLN